MNENEYSISVSPQNYFKTISNDKRIYFLPKYQRPYAWEEKQVDDFWNDLLFAFEGETNTGYIIGSIYLAKIENNDLCNHVNQTIVNSDVVKALEKNSASETYLIIDGQQRTTTFFLFLLAGNIARGNLNAFPFGNPNLVLGRNDFQYFNSLIDNCKEICIGDRSENEVFHDILRSDAFETLRPTTRSNECMLKTFILFKKRMETYPDEKLKLFVEFVEKKLTIIEVLLEKNIEQAISLFVSQTDRGKRLTMLEKLKSLLVFYRDKIKSEVSGNSGDEIDNLFSELFENVEKLCSKELRLYSNIDNAEADVMRILHFVLFREEFYNKLLNKHLRDKFQERKIDIWYEAGEERIYEALNDVFRVNLLLGAKERIKECYEILRDKLLDISKFYKRLAYEALNTEKANKCKDLYAGKVWHPLKQTYSVLGLSVPSKVLLFDLSCPNLQFDNIVIDKAEAIQKFDPFSLERIKSIDDKFKALTDGNAQEYGDLSVIMQDQAEDVFQFITKKYKAIRAKADRYKDYAKNKMSLFNLLEESELSIWKVNKRPYASYPQYNHNSKLDDLVNYSWGYKKEYLIRDLSYHNLKYVLYEYERINYEYTDEELDKIINYDIDEDDEIQIQREHMFPQTPENYDELRDIWNNLTRESYTDWIWNEGNIVLLEHNKNIGVGRKEIWNKAEAYIDADNPTCFKGTSSVAKEILELKKLVDEALYNKRSNNRSNLTRIPFKLYIELRTLDILLFTFYRFA